MKLFRGAHKTAIHSAHSGTTANLSVLDRGPGIPANEVTEALQPFSRLNNARSTQSGAGLGLAIVEHIARMHGGDLKVLNRQGGGLEASITLPASTA